MTSNDLILLLEEVESALFYLSEAPVEKYNRAYITDLFFRLSDVVKKLKKEASK